MSFCTILITLQAKYQFTALLRYRDDTALSHLNALLLPGMLSNLGISVFLFPAIKSLDTLNDQIVQYLFSPKATEIDFENDLSAKDKEALQSSMALMRQLLQVRVISKHCNNKKVLLRERKRHTTRRVVSTHSVVLSWLTLSLPPASWT